MEFNFELILQIAGLTLGLIYLWLEYKADKGMWLVGLIMPMVSMCLYFRKGLYADFAINIYYFLIAVYGYIVWSFGIKRKNSEEKKHIPIRHVTARVVAGCAGVLLILWLALYLWLRYFTDSNVPVPDAFTTAASMVGMWLLARKYVEQWISWILVDAVCVGLYLYKEIPFYALLYAIYTVIAFFGYLKWRRLAAAEGASGVGENN